MTNERKAETLNPMCKSCAKLGKSCAGSRETVWTGCIFKTLIDVKPLTK